MHIYCARLCNDLLTFRIVVIQSDSVDRKFASPLQEHKYDSWSIGATPTSNCYCIAAL